MLMPTSPEFLALCRAQIALLTQVLGATLSIVYLAEEWVEGTEARLVPVAAYPETATSWKPGSALARLPAPNQDSPSLPPVSLSRETLTLPSDYPIGRAPGQRPLTLPPSNTDLTDPNQAPVQQQQVVVPLVYEEGVVGLLVAGRDDRPWSQWELAQIEQIASALAAGCVLDQRFQWLQREHHQQKLLQARQYDLLDNLLHQFRNPLTALRTFGKLLIKRLRPDEPNRDVAASIVRESDRLQELLQQFDQVLDLGRETPFPPTLAPGKTWEIQAEATPSPGEAALSTTPPLLPLPNLLADGQAWQPCLLSTVLEPLLVSAQAIAQERSIALHTVVPAQLPPVQAHGAALREVLSNLIDNALKYTPSGGSVFIRLGLQRVQEGVCQQAIVISDTGPGIPAQDLPHLFQRHYRGVQAGGAIPGTGLGLAIARGLVEQMQGEIEVFSPARPNDWFEPVPETPNPGTTLVVWLPNAQ